jgi:hypothetical protein
MAACCWPWAWGHSWFLKGAWAQEWGRGLGFQDLKCLLHFQDLKCLLHHDVKNVSRLVNLDKSTVPGV